MKLLENKIQHWWQAGLLGVIAGVPVGLVLEYIRQARFQAYLREVDKEFAALGMNPPEIMDGLRTWVFPVFTTLGFTFISLAIYAIVFVVRKHKRA